MENFKDLKTYLLSKKDNLVEYIKDKRSVLTNNVNKVISLGSGFIKDNSKKFVKGATAIALAGTMLVASGCGVQVDENGNVTSFGNYVCKKDPSQTQTSINNGYNDPNKNVDGAVIEVVDPNKNNANSNNQQNVNSSKESETFNDGAIIEVVNPNATSSNSNNTNKQPVSTGNSTTNKEEVVNDGAVIDVVGNGSSSNSNVIGSRPSNNECETESEPIYDDIIVVNPNEQETYETEVETEAEEPFDDGAIIEIVG